MDFKKKIVEEYKKCFDYLRSSKNFILMIVLIFVIFAFIGFVVPFPDDVSNKLLDYFKELILKTEGYSAREMIYFLLENNSVATFIGLFSGLFLGIFPIIHTIMNGFVLGFAMAISVAENGFISLWRLLPHGIFELPAVFISLGLGLKLGTFVFQKDVNKSLRDFFYNSIRVYLLIVLPLLVIAAFIEGILIVLGS